MSTSDPGNQGPSGPTERANQAPSGPRPDDTAEVPVFAPAAQPPAAPGYAGAPPSRRGRGCVIGCLVTLGILVLLLVAGLFFAKSAWDDWTSDDGEPDVTTTTVPLEQRTNKPADAVAYAALVTPRLEAIGDRVETVLQTCQDVSNVPPCRAAVVAFRDELQALQTELGTVAPPSDVAGVDSTLRASLDQGIDGTNQIIEGIDGPNLLKVGRGLADVTGAAAKLAQAEAELATLTGQATPPQ